MFIGIKKQLRDWDEETPIQSLRFMPSEYVGLGTYARPTKFHRHDKGRSSKTGMSGSWEENLLQQRRKILDAMQHYEDIGRPVTDKHRERLLSGHLPLPGYEEGYELEGSWVSPADLRTILNPDVTFSQQRPTTLVGITQSPNYYRTNREADKYPFPTSGDRVDEILEYSGDDGGGAHEGFHYGGFDPNTMFRMPTPQGASHPMSIATGLNRGDDKTWDWLERLQENPNIPVGRYIDDAAWNQWQQTPRLGLDQLIEQGLVYPRTIKGKPMEIAFQLLKGRKMSPEAKKHKLEYDTKYQSSPERVKYRVELNRERRRRGIYGSGNGKDVSHTKGGKLTLENEHDNRARHFKGRGTLRDDKS
jgi:hypothetical protein